MVSNKNILIAQGGGPTNVINQSLVGIIQQENNYKSKILGSINGVNGIINNRFISLNKISDNDLKIIANTPGAALGSTRDKPDKKYCKEILTILKNKKISKFYYIGGNDSSDSLRIISEYAKDIKYNLQCIHIPKTIDNDLVCNDHTPGFGSAAKYVAQLFSGINYDVKSLIAISEGIQDKNKRLISQKITKKTEYDAHGNIQLSGTGSLGDYLSEEIKEKLKLPRVRADTLGYPQRCFLGSTSEIDQKEALKIGRFAVKYSNKNNTSFSAGILERKKFTVPYRTTFIANSLERVAGKTKIMPQSFYNMKKSFVTNSFLNYALPLIGKKILKTKSII